MAIKPLRRFESEAKAAGSLSHPNIVALYERGEIDNHKYIVMELVEGQALHQLMSQEPRPSLERSMAILRQTVATSGSGRPTATTEPIIRPDRGPTQQDPMQATFASCAVAPG